MARKKSKRKARARVVKQATPRRERQPENPRRIAIKHRLREWGKWRRSWHVGPLRVTSSWRLWLGPPGGARAEADRDDAAERETHDLVDGLLPQLRDLLWEQYVVAADSLLEDKARACGFTTIRGYTKAVGRALDAFEIRAGIVAVATSRAIERAAAVESY
jgi:hypothetical protein